MNTRTLFAPALLIAIVLAGCKSEEKAAKQSPPPAAATIENLRVEETAEITLTAKVKAVNHTTREVTLRGDSGHEVTFIVGSQVKRLNEVLVGDEVTTRYSVSFVGERRAPTADESANPIVAIGVGGRASSSADPAADFARGYRVLTTVQAIDLPNMLVTLQGPMGDRATFRARSVERVKKLNVGDTVIITYTEAVAVSLDKVGR